jgi:hypothetical protein
MPFHIKQDSPLKILVEFPVTAHVYAGICYWTQLSNDRHSRPRSPAYPTGAGCRPRAGMCVAEPRRTTKGSPSSGLFYMHPRGRPLDGSKIHACPRVLLGRA